MITPRIVVITKLTAMMRMNIMSKPPDKLLPFLS